MQDEATAGAANMAELEEVVVNCFKCPRLVAWREQVAADPPKRFRGEEFWARPVAGFGDLDAAIGVVGLAPAATGANRTGRIFTGDRSGDWLFAAMFRNGLANQPVSVSRDDGLKLKDAWVTAVVRCAPPGNKPLTSERDNCVGYLSRELQLLGKLRVIVALGGFAWDGFLRAMSGNGIASPRPKPRFGHGAEFELAGFNVVGCYHPSQQNTFTGRLTEPMIDDVFQRARDLAGLG